MGFGISGLVGLIITPFIGETGTLFPEKSAKKGRLFATFRHPLDRAVSMFKYLQYARWEPTYSPELKDWTLEEYASSGKIENNWMTRHLSGKYKADMTDQDLDIAKNIIRNNMLVGLINRLEESMDRFEAYFGLRYTINPTEQEVCREGLFFGGTNINQNTNKKIEKPKPGDTAYELIVSQNKYDIELYNYVVTLFDEQSDLTKDAPKNFRLAGAFCQKCGELEGSAMKVD